jgi:DNA-binding Lrp family transcriptional regulator
LVTQKILRKLKELSGSEAELSRRVKQLSRLGTLRNISTVIIQEALAMAITLDKTKDGLYLLGKEEEKEEIALNLLKEGLAEEVISRVTGLSLREVSQLKQRLSGKQ